MTIITKPSSTKKEEKAVPLVDPSVAPSLLVNKEKIFSILLRISYFQKEKKKNTWTIFICLINSHMNVCVDVVQIELLMR